MGKIQPKADTKMEICEGVAIEKVIRVGTILYVEEKLGRPLDQLGAGTSLKDVVTLLVGMVLQANPEMTEDEASKIVRNLTPDDVNKAAEVIKDIFQVELKNDQKTVQGNLAQ